MANRWGNNGNSGWLIFLGSKITADGDCSHEIKRRLLLGREVMTNLDSILKSRDIILPTKVHLVKAMVFPVVMYGCESWTINKVATAAAKSLQSCPTLCNPIDGSPPGSPVPGILQARTVEWVAISFSNAWKWKVKVKLLSHVRLFVTPWTAAYQAPPSMGFSRQEYWSGVPLPSPPKTATQPQISYIDWLLLFLPASPPSIDITEAICAVQLPIHLQSLFSKWKQFDAPKICNHYACLFRQLIL